MLRFSSLEGFSFEKDNKTLAFQNFAQNATEGKYMPKGIFGKCKYFKTLPNSHILQISILQIFFINIYGTLETLILFYA